MKLLLTLFACLAVGIGFASTLIKSSKRHNGSLQRRLFKLIQHGRLKRVASLLHPPKSDQSDLPGLENSRNQSGWTPLHVAAYYDRVAILEMLLRNFSNIDLNPLDEKGQSPLHLASCQANYRIVEIILKNSRRNGGDKMVKTVTETVTVDRKWTPIFYLANSQQKDNLNLQKTLAVLANVGKANLFHFDYEQRLAVHVAFTNRRTDIVEIFVGREPRLATQTIDGQSMSHLSAKWNLVQFLQDLENYFDPRAVDIHGNTPLCYAAQAGALDFGQKLYMLRLPVDYGDCKLDDLELRGSPLHAATFYRQKLYLEFLLLTNERRQPSKNSLGGSLLHTLTYSSRWNLVDAEIVDLILVDDKVELEAIDSAEMTPFLSSVAQDKLEMGQHLLKAGANIFAVDAQGMSCLHLVKSIQMLEFIVNRKMIPMEILTRNELKMTPLLFAVKSGKPLEIINYLIKLNASILARDSRDNNVAHLSVECNHLPAFESLLDCSEKTCFEVFRQRNHAGLTPLLLAIHLNASQFALKMIFNAKKYPLKALMGIEFEIGGGNTAIHVASKMGNVQVVEALLERSQNQLANLLNVKRETALTLALRQSNFDVLKVFLERLTPSEIAKLVSVTDSRNRNVLHTMVLMCNFPSNLSNLQYLLSSPSTYQEDADGNTPLDLAVKINCVKVAVRLLTGQSCSRINKFSGKTPLHLAKSLGFDELLEEMLATGKCSLNQTDLCGYSVSKNKSPSFCGYPSLVRNSILLASHGTLPNVFCPGSVVRFQCEPGYVLRGSNQLTCSLKGNWEFEGGYCDDNCMDMSDVSRTYCITDGSLAFHKNRNSIGSQRPVRCHEGFTLVGPKYVTCGRNGEWRISNVTKCFNNKVLRETQTMLAKSIDKGDLATVKELLSIGYVDVMWRDDSAYEETTEAMAHYTKIWCFGVRNATMLHLALRCHGLSKSNSMATRSDVPKIVEWLLELGCSPNVEEDSWQYTPLHMACAFGQAEVVSQLLEKGAEKGINHKALNGWTALHFAAGYGHLGIMRTLLKIGAMQSLNATTAEGYTPLMLAAERKYLEAAHLLLELKSTTDGCRWLPC